MDNDQNLQEADDEQPLATDRQSPILSLPANPDSWFRQRLNHVRSEARKVVQLKSIRPFDEK
jgi:hypothetical protein